MKKYILIIGLIAVKAMLGAAAPADKEQLQPQTNCPVMGGKIDKKVYADYDGKRVYFCCAGCIPQFKKDPGTYLKKLEEEGIAPESIPAAAGVEKKEAPKDIGNQATPKAEHEHGGGCN